MKKRFVLALPLALLALLALLINANAAQDISAKVILLEGDVTVKLDDKAEWAPVAVNQELPQGAYLMTAFESNCELEFKDKSKMKVKELSKIQINKFATELKKVDAEVTLYNGSVRATVHKDIDTATKFQVKTPVSTISVRGTIEDITANTGFPTQVTAVEGVLHVENKNGQSIIIVKDEKTEVNKEGEPPAPTSSVIKQDSTADVKSDSVTRDESNALKQANVTPSTTTPTSNTQTEINEVRVKPELGSLTVRWK